LADYLESNPSYLPLTFVSYGFIHAGWTHLFINSAWLLAFGSLVARRIGGLRFLILFLGSASGGAMLHWVTHLDDVMPVIGASGAVSGIMAASVRFAFQPGESLSGFSLHSSGSYRAPALPLLQTLRDKRTLRFILLWLGVNIATGLVGGPLGLTEGGIAWEAHIGGFLVGLLLFNFVDPPILGDELET
jgi:membrane associated rhomboid family serine protease